MNTTITKSELPAGFRAIRDQTVAVQILTNAIRQNRLSHAYLFWGPEGVGKKFTAKIFAQTVICSNSEQRGCGICSACVRIQKEIHPDVLVFKPLGKTRLITVETIEEINEIAQFRPYEAQRRFILIENADRIGIPAQNHFLKTLEEPPTETTFILLSANPDAILPTIRSRCQPIRFQRLHTETVAQILTQLKQIDNNTAHRIALLSQGQISRAFDILESDKRTLIIELFTQLANRRDPLQLTIEFEQFLELLRKKIESEWKQPNVDKKQLTPQELNFLQQQLSAEIEAELSHEFESLLYLITCVLRDIIVYSNMKTNDALYFPELVPQYGLWTEQKAELGLEAIEKVRSYLARNINREKVIRDLFFTLSPHV